MVATYRDLLLLRVVNHGMAYGPNVGNVVISANIEIGAKIYLTIAQRLLLIDVENMQLIQNAEGLKQRHGVISIPNLRNQKSG